MNSPESCRISSLMAGGICAWISATRARSAVASVRALADGVGFTSM